MAAPEYIVVGLGNPGDKYAQNRHNVGFMALDYIALRENVKFQNLRFQSLTAEIQLGGKKCLLLKPQTFMNLSGTAIAEAARFYKIPNERVIVLHDEISFDPGFIRIRRKGSAGGHNGLKSIIECLGGEDFPRVKIGVGKKPRPDYDLVDWVLGRPNDEDLATMVSRHADICSAVELMVRGEIDEAMQKYSK